MNLSLDSRPAPEAETDSNFDPKRRPVDLAHLSRYTMGNAALEREVLELFRRQTRLYFDKLSRATNDDSWREAVRVLKASARSVGAWRLLKQAEAAELVGANGSDTSRQDMMRGLSEQIEEAHQFIDSVL